MSEIGNWYIDANLFVRERCYSWCRTANCIFVDQPVMTGFSFQTDLKGKPKLKDIEYTNSSESATEQIWGGLDQLFKIWPKLRKAPLFVTGES